MGDIIASGASVYAQPVGLSDICLNDKDATLPLAGGVSHFSAYRFIASQYGKRIFEKVVALGDVEPFLNRLSDAHQQRLRQQMARATMIPTGWAVGSPVSYTHLTLPTISWV